MKKVVTTLLLISFSALLSLQLPLPTSAQVLLAPIKLTLQSPIIVYRIYNPNSGLHHYTKSLTEYNKLANIGWRKEGISFYAFDTKLNGNVQVYRQYNPNDGNHNWTTDKKENDYLISIGWHDEGIAWYSIGKDYSSDIAYRIYNPNSGEHVYTLSKHEKDIAVSKGWHDEGIGFYSVRVNTLAPIISSISPNKGTTDGGTLITIKGNNFAPQLSPPQVIIQNKECTNVKVLSNTTLTCITPKASVGKANLQVITTNGTKTVNGAFEFIEPRKNISVDIKVK